MKPQKGRRSGRPKSVAFGISQCRCGCEGPRWGWSNKRRRWGCGRRWPCRWSSSSRTPAACPPPVSRTGGPAGAARTAPLLSAPVPNPPFLKISLASVFACLLCFYAWGRLNVEKRKAMLGDFLNKMIMTMRMTLAMSGKMESWSDLINGDPLAHWSFGKLANFGKRKEEEEDADSWLGWTCFWDLGRPMKKMMIMMCFSFAFLFWLLVRDVLQSSNFFCLFVEQSRQDPPLKSGTICCYALCHQLLLMQWLQSFDF